MMQQDEKNTPAFNVEWTIKEQREILRELIIHEDNLTISRSQSLYTIQGFLFASLGLLAKGSELPVWALKSFTGIISFVGISAAVTYFIQLKDNDKAITSITVEWNRLSENIPNAPRVIGYKNLENVIQNKIRNESRFRLPRKSMPIAFITAWVLIFILIYLIPLQ